MKCLFSLQSYDFHVSLKTNFLKIQKEGLKRVYFLLNLQGKSICFWLLWEGCLTILIVIRWGCCACISKDFFWKFNTKHICLKILMKVQSQILTWTIRRKANGRNYFCYKPLKYKSIYQSRNQLQAVSQILVVINSATHSSQHMQS